MMPTSAAAAHLRRDRLARYLLMGAGAAAAGYGAYCLYHSEAVSSGRRQLAQLRMAVAAYADAFGTGADTLQLLLADLRSFLQSDRQQVPPSLRQLARLMQSPEVADTTSATIAALMRGVTASSTPAAPPTDGHSSSNTNTIGAASPAAKAPGDNRPALDRVLEALLSERGQGLVSVVVSLGARNLVTAYCDAQHRHEAEDAAAHAAASASGPGRGPGAQPDITNRLLDFLSSPRGQQLAVMSVTAFVSSGMRVYLDQTLDLNFYEDLFGAMAKPEHLEAVKQCVGVFARDVVGAYLAGPPPAADDGQGSFAAAAGRGASPPSSICELLHGSTQQEAAEPSSPCGSSASGGWARQQQHTQQQQEPDQQTQQPQQEKYAGDAAAPSDIHSDVLLHPHGSAAAKTGGGNDSARSHDSGWAVRTPPPAGEAGSSAAAARPVLPQLRRVQQQIGAPPSSGSLSREGSGNLEWISAVGKEWLNVAQHPQGRTVMVELAGTAAKEAARGVSAALADRFRLQWLLVAAFATLLMAWVAQRMLGMLLH